MLCFCTFHVTIFTVRNLKPKRFFIPPGIFTRNKITAFSIPASLVRGSGQKLAVTLFELTPVEYYALTMRFLTAVSDQRSFLRQQTPDLPSRSVRGSGQYRHAKQYSVVIGRAIEIGCPFKPYASMVPAPQLKHRV